jgi:NADH-quinone oxidoreductase subunit F
MSVKTVHEPILGVADLDRIRERTKQEEAQYRAQVLVCAGAGCISSKCGEVRDAVEREIAAQRIGQEVIVRETGCMGICAVGPVMIVLPEKTFYARVTPESAREIVRRHLVGGEIATEHTFYDESLHKHVPCYDDIDFFRQQLRIALRNCGLMDYRSLDAYIARDGYRAAAKAVLTATPGEVVEEVMRSGIKGRGGRGSPPA